MTNAVATERTVRADGVELATQAFGDPSHPPILLIMGAMASMLWWPEGFCRQLAGKGRFVIRYDNRDTGRSTTYEPGKPGYTAEDMVDDTMRVLDGYGLPAAHLVGMSAGGTTAQLAALEYPDRVLTLTTISTSPVDADWSRLPGSTLAYAAHAASAKPPDWSDRDAVIAYLIEEMRIVAGTAAPFDEDPNISKWKIFWVF